MADATLDTKGLKCPLPVLKARKALKPMKAGQRLEILATDPSSVMDFKNFCETTGDSLLESEEKDGVFRYLIQKAG